jgi:hypothetical protein
MIKLETLLTIAGALHFAVLIASALVPSVLDWRSELAKVSRMTRHVVWVHGVFIVVVIVGFGALTLLNASDLCAGSPLARSVCAFIALFWGARLILQFALFDPAPYSHRFVLRMGNHGLTVLFAYFTVVYGWGALWPDHAVLAFWSGMP